MPHSPCPFPFRHPNFLVRISLFTVIVFAGCASPPPASSTLQPSNPSTLQPSSPVLLTDLTCDHLANPVGLGDPRPRFSWKLVSDRPGEIQTAYQIQAIAQDTVLFDGKPSSSPPVVLWDSGKVSSSQSILVPWGGQPLPSRARVLWTVRVWAKDGLPALPGSASFELGLLNPAADWHAQWITSHQPRYDILQSPLAHANWISAGSAANQAAAVRTTLILPPNTAVLSATIDAAADGLLTLYVNGQPLRQGPSSHTAPFHADFPTELAPGPNVIALGAAPVRNAGRNGALLGRNAIAAHLVIILDNGQTLAFDTNPAWSAAIVPNPPAAPPRPVAAPPVPVPTPDWATASFDASAWPAATDLGPYASAPSTGSADSTIGPVRYLRKTFSVYPDIVRARLYSTALGVYQASLNGAPVNDHQLDPGWTDYFKRVMVQTTDVTNLLHPGSDTLGLQLADGWFAGRLGWMGLFQYQSISSVPLCAAQLEITYADGSTQIITTDSSWQSGPGEILGSDQQLGEIWDARAAVPNWNTPAGDSAAWSNVTVVPAPVTAVVPQVGPPVRTLLTLAPKKITRLGSTWIVDLGQNMVGHVRLTAQGPANTTIIVQHGEMLNADGTVYTENLRPAISVDQFTLAGTGAPETFEPLFTFHGFRYVQITGYPGSLTADNIRGIVVGSDTPATGSFSSSSADLNQLFSNIVWGQRGNFLSVPTDCPQRDERMGWMGDAQVFAPTAARNADVAAFFTKWLIDVDDGQSPRGDFSDVSPRVARPNPAMPVWGDAGVIIPWTMYQAYGDPAFLSDNYDHMAAWVAYLQSISNHLIVSAISVGDHLAPVATPTAIMDTAYFAHSAQLLAQSAAALGKTADAARYNQLFHDIAAAFTAAFVGPDGSITAIVPAGRGFGAASSSSPSVVSSPLQPFDSSTLQPSPPRTGNTQAAYLVALAFDLLPDHLRPLVAQRLADNITQAGHLTTGFPGSGLLCPTLTQIGRSDLAWQLLFTDTYPSWLFSIRNGATTIWERWDGWTPERGFQASSMNSFNHYSFGAVGSWLYSGAAGILPDESAPGYKHFYLQPQFTPRLTQLAVTLDSPYGNITSAWHATADQLHYDCTIPPNTSATLTLPGMPAKGQNPPPGATIFLVAPPPFDPSASITIAATTVNLPAGTYHFSFPANLIR